MSGRDEGDGGGPEGDDGALTSPTEPVGVDAVDDPAEEIRGRPQLAVVVQGVVNRLAEEVVGRAHCFVSRVWAMDRNPRCRCVLTELVDTPSVSAMSGMERSR